jgi:hypothetical protein
LEEAGVTGHQEAKQKRGMDNRFTPGTFCFTAPSSTH